MRLRQLRRYGLCDGEPQLAAWFELVWCRVGIHHGRVRELAPADHAVAGVGLFRLRAVSGVGLSPS